VAEAAENMLVAKQNIDRQLNLITCGGNFDSDTREYSERVIVTSKLIE